jgi:hypothetical protein
MNKMTRKDALEGQKERLMGIVECVNSDDLVIAMDTPAMLREAEAAGARIERQRILEGIRDLPKPKHSARDTVGFRAGYRIAVTQVLEMITNTNEEG